jgi:hypothetical protein
MYVLVLSMCAVNLDNCWFIAFGLDGTVCRFCLLRDAIIGVLCVEVFNQLISLIYTFAVGRHNTIRIHSAVPLISTQLLTLNNSFQSTVQII